MLALNLVDLEYRVDSALSKMCASFNAEIYEKLQLTYKVLGKTQMAVLTNS